MSKFKLVFLSTLVLAIALLCPGVAAQNTCADVATNKNTPFLTYMKTLSPDPTLTTMTKLSTVTEVCDGIWESSGRALCCDTRQVTKAFFAMIFDGFTNWRIFVKSLVIVRRIIQKYTYSRDDLETKLISMAANPTIYDFGGLTANQILSLFDWAVGFQAELILFRKEGLNCFNSLTATRAVTVCEGCVYQNTNTYFTTADPTRIRFKDTTCSSIWTSCSRSWRFVTNTQLLYYAMQQVNIYDRNLNGQVKIVKPMLFFDQPGAAEPSTTLLKDGLTALNTCFSGECEDANKQKVCHYMFSVIQSDKLHRMNENLLLNMSIYTGSATSAKQGQVDYVAADAPLGAGIDVALAKPSIGKMALNSTQLGEIDLGSAGGIRSGLLLKGITTGMLVFLGLASAGL